MADDTNKPIADDVHDSKVNDILAKIDKLENQKREIFDFSDETDSTSSIEDDLDVIEPTDASQLDIEKHLVHLYHAEPFWGHVSRSVTKRRSHDIPTACVSVRKREFLMQWNDKFFSRLSDKQILGVLQHELMHLVFEHCTKRVRPEPKLWNFATDLAINSLIGLERLPKGLLFPGKRCDPNPLFQEKLTQEQELAVKKFNDLLEKLPANQSSDWYYDKLIQEGAEDMLSAGDGVIFGQFDGHDGWGGDGDEDIMTGKLKEIVRKAIEKADSNNQWGTVPMEVREELRDFVRSKINWRAILRNFVGFARSSTLTNSLKRINKRYPYIHPGRKRGYQARMLICIDQSGSVGDEDVALAFGALAELSTLTTFTVLHFDHTVDEDNIYVWRRGQKVEMKRTRHGGTSFDAPTQWANDHAADFDGMIIITDGECSKPMPSRIKRGWLIVPDRKLMFETEEIVISMERDKDKDK